MGYGDLSLTYDDHDLWTRVTAANDAGVTAVANDTTAQTTYGIRVLDAGSAPLSDGNEVADRANGLLARYKSPAVRPASMDLIGSSSTAGATSSLKEQLSRVIGDAATVKRLPPGGGSALSVSALVEAVSHRRRATRPAGSKPPWASCPTSTRRARQRCRGSWAMPHMACWTQPPIWDGDVMAWTTPRTWTTSEVVTAAMLNTHVRDNLTFLRTAHAVKCYSSLAAIATGTGVVSLITFNSELFDTDGFHSTAVNTGRITIPTGFDGTYAVFAQVTFVGNATGRRWLNIYRNGNTLGTNVARNVETPADAAASVWNTAGLATAVAGDYFELYTQQDSGGNLNVTCGDETSTTLAAFLIGS